MSGFLHRLEGVIDSRCDLRKGTKILVAVSGGLDSMTLLHALGAVAEKRRWRIVVAHFNHQLRGRSSDADEKLVRKTAAKHGWPVVADHADVRKFARGSKLSIEMAARKLRHEFLARVARERNISNIALAHHADDQVEQFFLRLLRGAGGEGLAGMKWRAPSPADPKIMLVRPLLGFTRAELGECAVEWKIKFREDATNVQLGTPRNRVRNELLPLLRKKYQPGLAQIVLRLMEIIGAESDVVSMLAADWWRHRQPDFTALPIAVQRRVLQSQLKEFGLWSDFDLIESLRQTTDVAVNVDPAFYVTRDPAGVVSLHRHLSPAVFNRDELTVELAGEAGETRFGGAGFQWRFDNGKKNVRGRSKSNCEFFDAAKVGGKITLRHWRPGDRFQPSGLKQAVKLQDLFVNAKIPRERRPDLIVAMTSSGELFWVEGLRISEAFKLTPETKRQLIWRWRR